MKTWEKRQMIELYEAIRLDPKWREHLREVGYPRDWIEFMEQVELLTKHSEVNAR